MNLKAFLAEFIATFALIFIGVGSIAVDHITNGGTGLLGIALAHGLTLCVMISATAAISGGHVNPAVTIGLFCAKKIDLKNTIGYVIFQCLGAIVAAWTLKLALPSSALIAVKMGTPSLGEGVTVGMGLLIEAILTFFLVFAVYGTAVDKRAPQMGGLFIGLTVAFDILVGGPLTGAAMNPARYIGPALLSGDLSNAWLYWVGPIVGGVFAAVVYKSCLEK